MKLGWIAAVVGLSLASSACGGTDVCQRGVDTVNAINSKIGSCSEPPATFDKQACEQGIGVCTDSDKKKINAYFDCVNNLKSCQAGQEQTFEADLSNCTQQLLGMSQDCLNAFFG